jgi:hypothetical protein
MNHDVKKIPFATNNDLESEKGKELRKLPYLVTRQNRLSTRRIDLLGISAVDVHHDRDYWRELGE